MKRIILGILLTLLAILLFQNFVLLPDANDESSIPLDIKEFYDGKIYGWGTLENWIGQETNTFLMEVDATWQDGKGFVDERYNFLNGDKIRRLWTINKTNDRDFIIKAPDIQGAVEGVSIKGGYDIHFSFIPQGTEMHVTAHKKFRVSSFGTAMVEIVFRKFGFKIAKLKIALIKGEFLPLLGDFDSLDIYKNNMMELENAESEVTNNEFETAVESKETLETEANNTTASSSDETSDKPTAQ